MSIPGLRVRADRIDARAALRAFVGRWRSGRAVQADADAAADVRAEDEPREPTSAISQPRSQEPDAAEDVAPVRDISEGYFPSLPPRPPEPESDEPAVAGEEPLRVREEPLRVREEPLRVREEPPRDDPEPVGAEQEAGPVAEQEAGPVAEQEAGPGEQEAASGEQAPATDSGAEARRDARLDELLAEAAATHQAVSVLQLAPVVSLDRFARALGAFLEPIEASVTRDAAAGATGLLVVPGVLPRRAKEAVERARLALQAEEDAGAAASVWIGIAAYPRDGASAETLLLAASRALDRAVATGPGSTILAGDAEPPSAPPPTEGPPDNLFRDLGLRRSVTDPRLRLARPDDPPRAPTALGRPREEHG
jgi:hypothetical protein